MVVTPAVKYAERSGKLKAELEYLISACRLVIPNLPDPSREMMEMAVANAETTKEECCD